MSRAISAGLMLMWSAGAAFGALGETDEQVAERFGAPLAESVDENGDGLRVYASSECKQVRVSFTANKSVAELHVLDSDDPRREQLLATLVSQNPDIEVYDAADGVQVGFPPGADVLKKWVDRSGRERSYTGTISLKEWEGKSFAVLTAEGVKVEIPVAAFPLELGHVVDGLDCTVTTLDARTGDRYVAYAVVARREHIDWDDAVSDPHSTIDILVRITAGDDVLFDRTICGVHRRKMEFAHAPIAYGLLAWSKAERHCEEQFPHFRDYAVGGCMVGEEKFASLYICPDCVSACQEYKQAHPEPPRD